MPLPFHKEDRGVGCTGAGVASGLVTSPPRSRNEVEMHHISGRASVISFQQLDHRHC